MAAKKYGDVRPNERGSACREQAARDKRNGLTPALMRKAEKVVQQTKVCDYPEFFSYYGRFFRLDLISRYGHIVNEVLLVNDDTNTPLLLISKTAEAVFQEATR